jgi:hypothetical protein
MLNGAAISWRSKRQPTIALSTTAEEFISASAIVKEVIYQILSLQIPWQSCLPSDGPDSSVCRQ